MFTDTLRADYAFIITPGPFVKSMILPDEEEPPTDASWDFELFPNPVRDVFYLRFPGLAPKDITILDVSGRQVEAVTQITSPTPSFPVAHLAQGIYYVRVADGNHARTKKLIIH